MTAAEFIETTMRNGRPDQWPGGPSWPTGSYAVESPGPANPAGNNPQVGGALQEVRNGFVSCGGPLGR
jgi:hypothetical protein